MSNITKKDVEHAAELARLSLGEEEKQKLTKDLTKILDYVDQLRAVDTSKVNLNLAEVKPLNQTRQDEAASSTIQEEILSQAPLRKDKFFEVKAILEE